LWNLPAAGSFAGEISGFHNFLAGGNAALQSVDIKNLVKIPELFLRAKEDFQPWIG
jgi:hypothetical protein